MHIESLKLENFDFGYEDKALFENINIELPVGEVVAISGDSGCGKSVLLKLLAGLLFPESGNYFINGDSVTEMSFEEFIPYRLSIGYSFDMGGLLSNKSIYENLLLPLVYHGEQTSHSARKIVIRMMKLFEIDSVAHHRPSVIPGGMRKAAVVIRSLIRKPDLLLLDDPTTGLSRKEKEILKKYIVEKRKENSLKTIFIVSEDMDFLSDLATTSIHIKKGSLHSYCCQKNQIKR